MLEEIKQSGVVEESATQTAPTAETKVDEKPEAKTEEKSKSYFKSFVKEDDWNNYESQLKEKHSKEIFDSLGVADKNGLESLINSKDSELSEMKKTIELLNSKEKEYESKLNKLNIDLILTEEGVNADYKNDLITLANSKVTDKIDFRSATQEILSKNPTWKSTGSTVKMGTDKGEVKKSALDAKLSQRYNWIK